jgi:hypothetical protein
MRAVRVVPWLLTSALFGCTVERTEVRGPSESVAPDEEELEAPMCDEPAVETGDGNAFFGKDSAGNDVWTYEARSGGVMLRIESYAGGGGLATSGERELTEKDASYRDCATCILVGTGCSSTECTKTYMPVPGGKLVVSELTLSVGATLRGALQDVHLREVTIDARGRTAPVAGGAPYCVTDLPFSADLAEIPEECDGRGHLHGDHCHCDEGYVTHPDDPGRCIPE